MRELKKWRGPTGSVPTLRGWVSATGELVKASAIPQWFIDSWNGVSEEVVPVATAAVVQTLNEAPSVERYITPTEQEHFYGDDEEV
jgi:hypothetical protein